MTKKPNPNNAVPPDILADLAVNLRQAYQAVEQAESYIGLLREAGEDITQAQRELVQQKVRLDNWRRTLEKRGVNVARILEQEEG